MKNAFLSAFLLAAVVTSEAGRVLDVEIRSEACGDPGKLGLGCGWAFIKVDGKDLSPHKRGHNIVILDAETGAVLETKSLDTHGDSSAGSQMTDFLYEQHGRHRIVLVAVQDEGSNYSVVKALLELQKLGNGETINNWYRSSLAFVGYGEYYQRPSWMQQVQFAEDNGPSVIKVNIPLGKHQHLPTV